MSSALPMSSAIRFSVCSHVVHSLSPSLRPTRPSNMSLKSIPLRSGDAHAAALAPASKGAIPGRGFAGFVTVGQDDHLTDITRQFESA